MITEATECCREWKPYADDGARARQDAELTRRRLLGLAGAVSGDRGAWGCSPAGAAEWFERFRRSRLQRQTSDTPARSRAGR